MPQRVPPQNIEAEESILAAIMIKEEVFAEVSNMIQAEDFYRQAHSIIFSVMQELFDNREPIDIVTVVELLKKKKEIDNVGGIAFITKLCETLPTAANAKYYAKIVKEKAELRRLIDAVTVIASKAYEEEEDTADIIDNAEQMILAVANGQTQSTFTHVKSATYETIERIAELMETKGAITGIKTGFKLLDHITSGLQPSDLILIAARPSMGKTAFVLNVASNVAMDGKVVAFFSLEMSKSQLIMRLLAAESSIDASKIKTGELTDDDWNRLVNQADKLVATQFYIDDTPGITVMDLRSKARRLKAERGLDLIVIDYLQLMQGKVKSFGDNRQQEISDISRSLKALARELDVPVIALSQLSRSVESRQVKKPMLSDLRESGSLEQDADIVMFLYREDYYNPESERQGLTDLIIAKHRNGSIGNVELFFQKEYTKFRDVAYNN